MRASSLTSTGATRAAFLPGARATEGEGPSRQGVRSRPKDEAYENKLILPMEFKSVYTQDRAAGVDQVCSITSRTGERDQRECSFTMGLFSLSREPVIELGKLKAFYYQAHRFFQVPVWELSSL